MLRRLWPRVLLLGLVLDTAGARAQVPSRARGPAADTATIAGRVVIAGSADPIRKARVTIVSGPGTHDPVFTDNNGRFVFDHVSPGRYTLSAAKAGYATTAYGARRASELPLPVDVAIGHPVEIAIALPRGAAITGRLVDDQGDPLVDINVAVSRAVQRDGRREMVTAGYTQTDDRGEYRLGGLSAGRYVVSASEGPPNSPLQGRTNIFLGPNPGERLAMARGFYPSGSTLSDAQTILLRPGDEAAGIDFTLAALPAPLLTISTTDAAGAPAAGVYTVLPVPTFMGMGRSGPMVGGIGRTRVDPGEWLVVARGDAGIAYAAITVGAGDVELPLVLRRGGTMRGRAMADGGGGLPPGLIIEAVASSPLDMPLIGPPAVGAVGTDGGFAVGALIGPRQFRLKDPPRGWRLKSLTVNGRSLLDGPLEFAGAETLVDAVAVLTAAPAALRGRVSPSSRLELPPSVIVFPQSRARRQLPSRWSRWVRVDSAGAFAVDDLPEGDYLAIAVDDVDEDVWSSEDYLQTLEALATPLTLRDGRTAEIALNVVHP